MTGWRVHTARVLPGLYELSPVPSRATSREGNLAFMLDPATVVVSPAHMHVPSAALRPGLYDAYERHWACFGATVFAQ